MEDEELKFLKMIGMAKKDIGKVPDFMVKAEKGKVTVVMRSKLEELKTFGQWAVVTISPQDFVNMANNFQAMLLDLKRRGKPKG